MFLISISAISPSLSHPAGHSDYNNYFFTHSGAFTNMPDYVRYVEYKVISLGGLPDFAVDE